MFYLQTRGQQGRNEKNTKCPCTCLGCHFPQEVKTKTHQNLEPWIKSTFHPFPHSHPIASRHFPPQILVRGRGSLRSAHPPRPWPREAARRLKRAHSWLRSAAVFRLGSRGPVAQNRRQNPTEPRGENLWENFGASNIEFLEIVATQKPPWT